MLIGAFSASVLHLGTVDGDELEEAPNILSTLLLSSDLKGFIEKPGFYFANGNIKRQDLDYLMLTQGWRNIDWTSLDTVRIPPYRAEKGIRIAGHTKKLGRKTPEAGATVQLFPTSSLLEYQETTADQNGYFEFRDLLFPDSMSFVLSARDGKGGDRIDLVLMEEDLPAVGSNRNRQLERDDVNTRQLDQITASNARLAELRHAGLIEGTIMIDEVQVNRKQSRVSNRSKNPYGAGNADHIFTAEDFKGHTHLGQCMMDQIGSVLRWDPETGWPFGGIGVYVLDGMSIDSIRVQSIPIDAIESVEVLANGFYGVDPKKIIFYITTKPDHEAFNRISVPRGKTTIHPEGLYLTKTFYKPTYEANTDPTAVKDLRTTIHWEPSIVINKGRHTHFDFYISDEPGTYCILLEGVDIKGDVWRQLSEFKVLSRESTGGYYQYW